MSDGLTIFVGGEIVGRRVGEGQPSNRLGTFVDGRPSTNATIAAARRFFREVDPKRLRHLGDGALVEAGTGEVFDMLVGADPLFLPRPEEGADAFVVDGAAISFLRLRGMTVEQVEQARAAQESEVQRTAEEERRFRSRQKQLPLTLDLLHGDGTPTLAEAATTIEALGGEVRLDELGSFVVTLPERLTADGKWACRVFCSSPKWYSRSRLIRSDSDLPT